MSCDHRSVRSRGARRAPVLTTVLLLAILTSPAPANWGSTGRWEVFDPGSSDPQLLNFGIQGIHMSLVRASDENQWESRVLYWGPNSHLAGSEPRLWNPWEWSAPIHTVGLPANSNPKDIFCAGHSALPDGRLSVVGGQEGKVGHTQSWLFDVQDPADRWTRGPDIAAPRWYPTSTTLDDGAIFTTSGMKWFQMFVHGGRGSSGVESVVRAFEFQLDASWTAPAPVSGRQREYHSVVFLADKADRRLVFFGGLDAGDPGDGIPPAPQNDVWVLKHDTFNPDDNIWSAPSLSVGGSAPTRRSRHTAIVRYPAPGQPEMIVFGGRGTGTQPFHDLFKLAIGANSATWSEFTSVVGTPSRYGHTAVLDNFGGRDRMIVFGGIDESGGLAPNDVRIFDFSTSSWSAPAVSGTAPPPREGHVAVLEQEARTRSGSQWRRMFVHGGRGQSGLLGDLWALWIKESTGELEWEVLTPIADPGAGTPGVRADHVAVHDARLWNRFVIAGGVTSTNPLTRSNDVWGLDLACGTTGCSSTPQWVRLEEDSPNLPRLSGHVAAYDIWSVNAKVPEIYSSGDWQPLSWARRWMPLYPFTFVLPSGKLFYAGPDTDSQILDLEVQQWGQSFTTDIYGSSAAMYEPGAVLKCGGPPNIEEQASDQTRAIDHRSPSPAWQSVGLTELLRRVDQNLTILPTGEVLVTGGTGQHKNISTAVKQPRYWSPVTTGWDRLGLDDPAVRDYHSTALLLPDGRVLSAGGENSLERESASIYSPYYLFTENSVSAPRPGNEVSRDPIGYSPQQDPALRFRVCTVDADDIEKVCLIKAGSVTHGLNMDQRYVPLTFSVGRLCRGTNDILLVDPPANPQVAPPGDYLLFLVNYSGVPSVGRWVRVDSNAPAAGADPICPHCQPSGTCPFVDTRTDAGWQVENSILGRSLNAELSPDTYRLRSAPEALGGRYRLRIRENEQEITTIDHAGLVAVDRPPGVRAYRAGQEYVLGTCAPAEYVLTRSGADISQVLDGEDGEFFTGQPGETLLVALHPGALFNAPAAGKTQDFPPDVPDAEWLLVQASKKMPIEPSQKTGTTSESEEAMIVDELVLGSSGIIVEEAHGLGGWRTLSHFYPRENSDEIAIGPIGSGTLRVIFVGEHRVGFLGRLVRSDDDPLVQPLNLLEANHSRLGPILPLVRSVDGLTSLITPGDTLGLEFSAIPPPAQGLERDWFLLSTGVYTSGLSKGDETSGPPASRPLAFALGAASPQPASGPVRISFSLAHSSHTSLRIFDAAGRSLRTLVDEERIAGEHEVGWDGRDDTGRMVSSGVYFYRMQAGSWHSQKKLVVFRR